MSRTLHFASKGRIFAENDFSVVTTEKSERGESLRKRWFGMDGQAFWARIRGFPQKVNTLPLYER
jgi:hypothetical protein